MERKENESYLGYVHRCTEYLNNGKIDYKEWADCILGYDNNYSSENARKASYFIKKMLPKFEGDIEITDNDIILAIEQERRELYKDKIKMRDQRRELNKILTGQARYEHLAEILEGSIKYLAEFPKCNFGSLVEKNITPKSAILQLSDWHVGAVVNTQWNEYSVDIAKNRAKQLCDKVKRYALNYNITDLMIEINGDMVEGLINTSNRVQSEEDVMDEIIIVSEMLSNFVYALKPYFNSIKIATTIGNHGRLVPNKKDSILGENVEKLIPKYMKLRLGDDIPIISSYGLDFTAYDFDGKSFVLSHGQDDKVDKAISDYAKVYKKVFTEIHLGHTHGYKDENKSNIMVTVNGSLKGGDEYALHLREVTKPSQNLIIYGEDRGIFELILE